MTSPCPVCGQAAIDQTREYTIQGQRVRMAFAACLHTPEEIAEAQARKVKQDARRKARRRFLVVATGWPLRAVIGLGVLLVLVWPQHPSRLEREQAAAWVSFCVEDYVTQHARQAHVDVGQPTELRFWLSPLAERARADCEEKWTARHPAR